MQSFKEKESSDASVGLLCFLIQWLLLRFYILYEIMPVQWSN